MLPITPELVSQGLEAYKETIRLNKTRLNGMIDGMTKNALKDMLKSYMGIQIACEVLEEPFKTNHDIKAVKAFEESMRLQEDCIGYITLKRELEESNV